MIVVKLEYGYGLLMITKFEDDLYNVNEIFQPYYDLDTPPQWRPTMKDYKKLWDRHYEWLKTKHDVEWYENYARLPGDLAPNYNVRYWRTIGHWWFRARYNLWFSAPIQSIVTGQWAVKVWKPNPWRKGQLTYTYKRKGFWNWFGAKFHKYEDLLRDWIGWSKWDSIDWYYCPHCGFKHDFISVFESDWFRFTGGGTRFTGEYTQHWFEGIWTCPRCLRQWPYEDSD